MERAHAIGATVDDGPGVNKNEPRTAVPIDPPWRPESRNPSSMN